MKRKKSKLLTFLCSLVPGAGHMYLGFMKMGLSLLLAFVGIICIASWTRIDQLVFVGFVVWVYSFFHIHNIAGAPDEEFQKLEDHYLISFGNDMPRNMQRIISISLILLGSLMLINVFPYMLPEFIIHYLPDGIFYYLPQGIIALVLIAAGIVMILGKKVSLEQSSVQNDRPVSQPEVSMPGKEQSGPVQETALVEKAQEPVQTVMELPAPDEGQQ